MNKSAPKRQTIAELHTLQRLMASALFRPLSASGAMRRQWSDGRPAREVAESFIKPNARLTSFERLQIYNRQYWYRVLDCFYDDYPGLRALLGEAKFHRLTIAYLSEHPSSSYTLRNLGQHLETFIMTQPKWTAPRQALALEIVRLEWAHTVAFDSEACAPLSKESLLGQGTELRFQLQPHITLLSLSRAFDTFLIALHRHAGLRSEASNAKQSSHVQRAVKLAENLPLKDTLLVVHRFRNSVFYKRISAAQHTLLTALQAGQTLATAVELALEKHPRAITAERIRTWFNDWAALGWFVSGDAPPRLRKHFRVLKNKLNLNKP